MDAEIDRAIANIEDRFPDLGRELRELQEALDSGALTTEEWARGVVETADRHGMLFELRRAVKMSDETGRR